MPKNMRIKVIAASSGVILLGGLPAAAQLNSQELGAVWSSFKEYTEDFRRYAGKKYEDFFSPEIVQRIEINRSVDNFNQTSIPNPVADGEQLRGDIVIKSESSQFEKNPVAYGTSVANQLNRADTQTAVSVYFRDEQGRVINKLQQADNIVESSVSSENKIVVPAITTASGIICIPQTQTQTPTPPPPDPTCQVVKEIAKIQGEAFKLQVDQTKIQSEQLGRTIQLQKDLQYTNLNLANISNQLEQRNRAQRVADASEAARLLRVASQTSLFVSPKKDEDPLGDELSDEIPNGEPLVEGEGEGEEAPIENQQEP